MPDRKRAPRGSAPAEREGKGTGQAQATTDLIRVQPLTRRTFTWRCLSCGDTARPCRCEDGGTYG